MSYSKNLGFRAIERVLRIKAQKSSLDFDRFHFNACMRRPGFLRVDAEINIVYFFKNTQTVLILYQKDPSVLIQWKIHFANAWKLSGELEFHAEAALNHVLKRAEREKGNASIELVILKILKEEFNSN